MYISYSAYKIFLDCERQYAHKYVLKTTLPKEDNRVHMLYGDAVGKIFELFYADQLWRGDTLERLLGLVKPTLNRIIEVETKKGGVFNWKDKNLREGTRSLEEVEQEVRDTIPRGLRTIRQHRLLGPQAQAEIVLDVVVNGHKIGGRADFLIRRVRPHGDLVLIDGKGSRWRDKYTNHRQLRWYAMQHWLKHGVVPDKLGFLYWRYEPVAAKPDEQVSMEWSKVSVAELQDLKDSVLAAIDSIEQSRGKLTQLGTKGRAPVFLPRPSDQCRLCEYLELCPEGQRAMSKEARSEIAESLRHGVEEGGVSF